MPSMPMPATPLGRGGTELRKTFSGSCLELDGLGDGPPSPLSSAHSPAHFSVNNKGVFGRPAQPILAYVSEQNQHRRMLRQNAQQTVYVTGASDRGAAFLATHIIAQLLHDGYRVRTSVRDESHGANLQRETRSSSGAILEVFTGPDLYSSANTQPDRCLQGVHAVIHCPSFGNAGGPCEGVRTVMERCKRAGVSRVLMTSSAVCVHQEASEGEVLTEDHWNEVSKNDDPVAWARVQAERELWAQGRSLGLSVTVIVCSTLVGPSVGGEISDSLMILCDLAASPIYFPFAPRISRNLVDVKDVAAAHAAAVTNPNTAGERYLVTGGNYTLSEIGHVMKEKYPGLSPPTRDAWDCLTLAFVPLFNQGISRANLRSILGYGKVYSTEKAREHLGLTLRHPDQAILDAVEDLISRGEISEQPQSQGACSSTVAAAALGAAAATASCFIFFRLLS
eukprot:TRINITY_DN20931_c0_g1_i1.p1 TRINITY_DN20931_c0_g1~~TRINITY_DN20931_c0_g1_i1.p1  ORF type:complete len:514 (+),score=127.91 TRINITY_DN20931_c0_g1_i1:192-1544(+)